MLKEYLDIIINSYQGYFNYLVAEITHPSLHNYVYMLLGVSLFFWGLEASRPWRKDQPLLRQDFFLDGFYMFFNFFLFPLLIFIAVSNLSFALFNRFSALLGVSNLIAVNLAALPKVLQLVIFFICRDFIQFNIHRLLHRSDFLWQFHQVHHSVKQMGFAAHLRFHWMENVFYRSLEFIPLGLLGFGATDFFLVHIFALVIGHSNHTNYRLPLGPLKYIFNNPQMHIWHHAKELPYRYGCNFGISLSIWDYLFKTDYIPKDGRDVPLGFYGDESFPKNFLGQAVFPLFQNKK